MKKYGCYITEFIIVGIVGSLWHFFYDWTKENAFVGAFAPVNESTFEHLKLLFFPVLIYSVIEFFVLKNRPENYIAAASAGIFTGMLAITAFFYTYTGILGYNIMVLDILCYFIGLAVMLYTKKRIIDNGSFRSKTAQYIFIIAIILMGFLFVVWTHNPPTLGIFTPPAV